MYNVEGKLESEKFAQNWELQYQNGKSGKLQRRSRRLLKSFFLKDLFFKLISAISFE